MLYYIIDFGSLAPYYRRVWYLKCQEDYNESEYFSESGCPGGIC
jgi:hypothetical protein